MAVTLALTALAVLMTAARTGPGFVLYAAMLGSSAVWILPVHVVTVLPAGLIGGVLLAGSGPRTSLERPDVRQVAAVTLVATVTSLYLAGWGMPAAYAATAAASARYVQPAVEAPAAVKPAAMNLPQLAAGSAAARAELMRRVWPVILCLVSGVAAAALVASPLAWSYRTALGGTAVAFLATATHLLQVLE